MANDDEHIFKSNDSKMVSKTYNALIIFISILIYYTCSYGKTKVLEYVNSGFKYYIKTQKTRQDIR